MNGKKERERNTFLPKPPETPSLGQLAPPQRPNHRGGHEGKEENVRHGTKELRAAEGLAFAHSHGLKVFLLGPQKMGHRVVGGEKPPLGSRSADLPQTEEPAPRFRRLPCDFRSITWKLVRIHPNAFGFSLGQMSWLASSWSVLGSGDILYLQKPRAC